MYDAAIVGAGPAGLSAALNLKLHNKNIIWFGSAQMSLKVEKSERIANYPGCPMISGRELNDIFKKQAADAGLEPVDRIVTGIAPGKNGYMLLSGNEVYEASTVLLATGSVSAAGFAGENDFLGKGVSYCATCDGFLYKEKTIAVFCGAKRYEHEVGYLAGLAKKLYLFTPYGDCEIDDSRIIMPDKPMREICGTNRVDKIILTDGREISVDGVFILRSAIAPSILLKGIEINGSDIVVNRSMETNKAGCYAAGDCTGRPYQIAKAAGEGNVAAHSILEYLTES